MLQCTDDDDCDDDVEMYDDKFEFNDGIVTGSPERTWVLDTDVLLPTTTSQSRGRPGNVTINQHQDSNLERKK